MIHLLCLAFNGIHLCDHTRRNSTGRVTFPRAEFLITAKQGRFSRISSNQALQCILQELPAEAVISAHLEADRSLPMSSALRVPYIIIWPEILKQELLNPWQTTICRLSLLICAVRVGHLVRKGGRLWLIALFSALIHVENGQGRATDT